MTRLLLLLLAFYTVRAAAGNATHSVLLYRHFFPAWDPYLQDYIKGACKDQIADYRNATFSDPRISYTVLDCMLKQFPEFRKAEASAAAVVLGLAPTILQLISPSPSSTALVALRRPFLALILSVAAPATSAPPTSTYSSTIAALSSPLPPHTRGRFPFTVPRTLGYYSAAAYVVSAVQYIIAVLAAGNSAYRTYQLCLWTVCTFVPTKVYLPALWHVSVVLLHFIGWVAMWLSVERDASTITSTPQRQPWARRAWKGLGKMCRSETTPGAFAMALSWKIRDSGPAHFFSLTTAALYAGVPVHVLYGTMVLSSLAFISAVDAVTVVAWYALSTVAIRAVVYFECAGTQAVASEAATLSLSKSSSSSPSVSVASTRTGLPPSTQMNGHATGP